LKSPQYEHIIYGWFLIFFPLKNFHIILGLMWAPAGGGKLGWGLAGLARLLCDQQHGVWVLNFHMVNKLC